MLKFAIIHGKTQNGVQKKSVEVLSKILLDYTFEYPVCFEFNKNTDYSGYTCIYIGTKENNPYIKENTANLKEKESYSITVKGGNVIIEGFDDNGVLYGCIDFYNKYILNLEYPHNPDVFAVFPFDKPLSDFEYRSAPSIETRGIWTWGHVIYDYKRFIDNMVLLKMNTVIIWNDYVPYNAKEVIDYAHSCGVKVIFGFSWCWDTDCKRFSLETINENSSLIFEKYEKEYSNLGLDGIYFQSFTELKEDSIGGVLIAKAVTDFVNNTSSLFFEKYPDLELQFGLHASSVAEKLEYIKNVNPKIKIVWEDCGAFPYSYLPSDVKDFEKTIEFTEKIAVLRGENDRFGIVAKGFTKLDWTAFNHIDGPVFIGTSSDFMKENRIVRKQKVWKYLQSYWLTNADKAYEMTKTIANLKRGKADITALVEDGMFEENIMFPIALYSEMLWDTNRDLDSMINEVALRQYVTFA